MGQECIYHKILYIYSYWTLNSANPIQNSHRTSNPRSDLCTASEEINPKISHHLDVG